MYRFGLSKGGASSAFNRLTSTAGSFIGLTLSVQQAPSLRVRRFFSVYGPQGALENYVHYTLKPVTIILEQRLHRQELSGTVDSIGDDKARIHPEANLPVIYS